MAHDELSRRAFLIAAGEALGIAALELSWSDVASAALSASAAAADPGSATTFLSAAEAADVEAIAAQIIPSDGTPGAREAGVVHFIDRALSSFFSRLAPEFRAQLADFRAACEASNPGVPFASLPPDRQIAFLKTVEETPFFDRVRLLTLFGMFSLPMYGGNVDGNGWKLIGFEDRHVFEPPFGYYDRDYPGFVIEPVKPA
jgi:gluconate 2-dehydrogenase gamma chain